MSTYTYRALALSALLVCQSASAQLLERDLGDFDLKLGSTPARSMAQGLVQPTGVGSFHGGLDLTHDSGWYAGQWSPSVGATSSAALEVDSYLGFKKPFDKTLGYELGMIRYTYPDASQTDSHQFYAGLTVLGSRFGAALSNDPGNRNSTLFVDLGTLQPMGLGLRVQYANHQFDTPQMISDGSAVSAFNDWSLNVSRPWFGVDLNLTYSDSSLSGNSCSAYTGHNAQCEGMFTLKAVRSFF